MNFIIPEHNAALQSDEIVNLFQRFEAACCNDGVREYWSARDLQHLFGYDKWERFMDSINRAKVACMHAGRNVENEFPGSGKFVQLGAGGTRQIQDILLSRYAAYLVAQNGDSRKPEIAFAQTYFATMTHTMEIIARRYYDNRRLAEHVRIADLWASMHQYLISIDMTSQQCKRINACVDTALFGGYNTGEMKARLNVPPNRELNDFLPEVTLLGKNFAAGLTNHFIRADNLQTEEAITTELVRNNATVRQALIDRGYYPEDLPAAEDIRKVERRITADHNKVVKSIE